MTESKNSNPKVGELLTRAGVLRKQDLHEAISIAQDTGQMIGKVLIMSGFITKEDLAAAVEAQSLIRDGLLEVELAILGLSTASREHLLLEQALDQLGWHPQNKPTAKLGELLIASGNINIDHLSNALDEMRESVRPLGSLLVEWKVITRELLQDALNIQTEIRDGKLSKPDGVKRLARHAKMHALSISGQMRMEAQQ
ncbi:MAG: hypothetical protein JST01_27385 [Cyanobacteria bacterium SZAS TMP-1]|nr:hypothetical protein [Cyanobacteria bacterium SZAS TMP-1]